VHKNNVSRRGKLESNLSETVRIASRVQKGVQSGRSSYVEMRALARLTSRNVLAKVHRIQADVKNDDNLHALLKEVGAHLSEGYVDVLTPNGIIREDKLDTLLSLDADIVICLDTIVEDQKHQESENVLQKLVEERKKFVAALKV